MSEVDVFTTSEERLRDLVVIFSRLRYPSCNLACVAALRDWGRAYVIGASPRQAKQYRQSIHPRFCRTAACGPF